ncbi:MAG TPA: type II CAAX endopeptidase family protein [Bryobacteraceae bacterium]|nr:type II CAAX endopeptidase family protein [Bryobacteraceae bacterium]
MTASNHSQEPFWTYEDLALFLGSLLPIYVVAAMVLRLAHVASNALNELTLQSLIYALTMAMLYLLIAGRHGQPFWRSLGWKLSYRGVWICLPAGPVLALAMAKLGEWLHTPAIPSPLEGFISDRKSLVVLMIFVTVIGPIWEELLFRGFLYPLLAKSVGPWLGIVLSAIPFALLHGAQNQWSWQYVLLIFIAGCVFGYTRYKTGSTAAAAIVHAGYNVLYFAGFLVQRNG